MRASFCSHPGVGGQGLVVVVASVESVRGFRSPIFPPGFAGRSYAGCGGCGGSSSYVAEPAVSVGLFVRSLVAFYADVCSDPEQVCLDVVEK